MDIEIVYDSAGAPIGTLLGEIHNSVGTVTKTETRVSGVGYHGALLSGRLHVKTDLGLYDTQIAVDDIVRDYDNRGLYLWAEVRER